MSMGFRPTKADTNIWIKAVRAHYKYLATYVDDVLVYSKDPLAVINAGKKDYALKGIRQSEYYVGGDVLELNRTWQNEA
jgi:hypothetical protein